MLNEYITRYRDILTIIAVVLLSSVVLYIPFFLGLESWLGLTIESSSMKYIYQHFDGLLYVIASKTLYRPDAINALHVELVTDPNYYPAHLPLYPVLIRSFSYLFGYLQAMLAVTLLFSVLAGLAFYYVIKKLKVTENPLGLTIVFLFLPRFFIVRSVGAPESIFLFFILLSLYFFEKKQFVLSGLFGAFSVMTKSPGILLVFAYGLVFLEGLIKTKKFNWSWLGIGLIPMGLLSVFTLYYFQTGDFFAYFNSGDNIHLVSPFAAFNHHHRWVGTAWLEEIVLYLFIYLIAIFTLKESKYRSLFYFALVFFTATIFVQHRDISRYILPVWPLACVAYEKFFTSRKFLIALVILLPAIYLYAWNFMTYNLMPISDWTPYI